MLRWKKGTAVPSTFLFAKGIITQEQANCIFYTRVQIENNGKIISGAFKDNLGIRDLIKKRISTFTRKNTTLIRISNLFKIPKTESTVKKMKSVEWYLCLDENGVLVFKNHSKVERKDYLLAEMKSKEEFSLTPDTYTSLTAFYNNVPDY
uniref:Uncharacterized protein n=1 Tax=Panagrolaimus davidi TaxID=227884 RepID=A0A914Q793_9BILA